MAAPVAKADRPAAAGGVELGGGREPSEPYLVQALAPHPGAGGETPRPPGNRGQQVLDGSDARFAAVEVRLARGKGEKVEMRIDETGQNRRASAVDLLRARTSEAAERAARAEREDAALTDRDRCRPGPPRIERQHAGVLEEPVGVDRPPAQSDEGRGFASFTFIS